jgi:type I restriction enzyme M protein
MTNSSTIVQRVWNYCSLEDSANLPDPDVLAAEIVEDLQAALAQFAAIAEELGDNSG